jgi:hypothetical protein
VCAGGLGPSVGYFAAAGRLLRESRSPGKVRSPSRALPLITIWTLSLPTSSPCTVHPDLTQKCHTERLTGGPSFSCPMWLPSYPENARLSGVGVGPRFPSSCPLARSPKVSDPSRQAQRLFRTRAFLTALLSTAFADPSCVSCSTLASNFLLTSGPHWQCSQVSHQSR